MWCDLRAHQCTNVICDAPMHQCTNVMFQCAPSLLFVTWFEGAPMHQCDVMHQCTNAPMHQCDVPVRTKFALCDVTWGRTNAPMWCDMWCTNAPMHQCTNVMWCANAPMHQCDVPVRTKFALCDVIWACTKCAWWLMAMSQGKIFLLFEVPSFYWWPFTPPTCKFDSNLRPVPCNKINHA
jgi:hypothetical protein